MKTSDLKALILYPPLLALLLAVLGGLEFPLAGKADFQAVRSRLRVGDQQGHRLAISWDCGHVLRQSCQGIAQLGAPAGQHRLDPRQGVAEQLEVLVHHVDEHAVDVVLLLLVRVVADPHGS